MNAPLAGRRILITGIGIKPMGAKPRLYYDIVTQQVTHLPVVIDNVVHKANIGTAAALACLESGAAVHLVARRVDRLIKIKAWLEQQVPGGVVDYTAADLSDQSNIAALVTGLPNDLPLHWVQSLGLGAGTIQVPHDNPYLPVEKITPGLIEAELGIVSSTLYLLQALLPIFKQQAETRIVAVTSMSAVRSLPFASAHMAGKGGLSHFLNAVAIEMEKSRIYLTDIRPGGVDTGLYDGDEVRASVVPIAASYGYDWSPGGGDLRLMSPLEVGRLIVTALAAACQVRTIDAVARGQWPHVGS